MAVGTVTSMANQQPMPTPEALRFLAEAMKSRRRELNKMSQEELAIASGLPKGTIGTIEAGNLKGPPTIQTLRGIERGLRLPAGTFLGLFYPGLASIPGGEMTPEKQEALDLLDLIEGEDLEAALMMLRRLVRK